MRTRVRSAGCALIVTLATTLAGVLAAPAGAQTPPSPWLQSGYNAARSNANLVETGLDTSTIAAARPLRSIAPVGRDCYGARAQVGPALLSESRVYAVNGTALVAYTATTGAPLWRTPLSEFDQNSVVAVSHGLVVVAGNECGSVSDATGVVQAFRSDDGTLAWSMPAPQDSAVVGVSVSGKYLVLDSDEEGTPLLSVYRVQDGGPVWSLSGDYGTYGPDVLYDGNSAVVRDQVYTLARTSENVVELQARHLETGALVWSGRPARNVERGDLDTADGAHVYAFGYGGLADLDPTTGDARVVLAGGVGSLAVDDRRVYATCADDATIVCAFDRSTGKRLWVRGVHDRVGGAVSADGVLYLASGLVLDGATGHTIRTLPGTVTAVGQGRVAVTRRSGSLVLYGAPGA